MVDGGGETCWTALLASGLRLGQELALMGTRQHLLITRAAERLPRSKANGLGGVGVKRALLPQLGGAV
jgi:precorrin-4 methylase